MTGNNKYYKEITDEFKKLFDENIRKSESIVITSHKSPDDDSISSCLAMYYYLTAVMKINKEKIRILYTGEKENKWNYFKNYEKIEYVDDIYNYLKPEELIILLDGSGWHRFSRNDDIRKHPGFTICIDHHTTLDDNFNLHVQATSYSACAELVYSLFLADEKLDRGICETVLLGILGDTGNFRFVKPEQSRIFLIAERLVREGNITVETLQSKYSAISERSYLALQEIMKLSEIKEIKGWPRFIVSYLPKEYKDDYSLTDSEITEASMAFTPYLKEVSGVEWGIVITPRSDKMCSFSLRSIPGSVSVRLLAEQMKAGGGHDRAAGGKINKEDPKEVLAIILKWMAKHKPVLN